MKSSIVGFISMGLWVLSGMAQQEPTDPQKPRLARIFEDSRWSTSVLLASAQSKQLAFGFKDSGMNMTNALIDAFHGNGTGSPEAGRLLEASLTPCLWNYALRETREQTQSMAESLERKQDPKFHFAATLRDPIAFDSNERVTKLTCVEYESVVDESGSSVQLRLSYETWKQGDSVSVLGEIEIEGFDHTNQADFARQRDIMLNLHDRMGSQAFEALFLCLVPMLPKG